MTLSDKQFKALEKAPLHILFSLAGTSTRDAGTLRVRVLEKETLEEEEWVQDVPVPRGWNKLNGR